jgi:arginine/lysine/ornithine decarboxylase
MALETLKGITEIGGFEVMQERPLDEKGFVDWDAFDEQRKEKPIYVDHDVNMISFRIQKGPIKEVGSNGAQVDTLIHAARIIIEKLNEQFPCIENKETIEHLEHALLWLAKRKMNREMRGVEGTSDI